MQDVGGSEWQSGNAASLVTALEKGSPGPRRGCGKLREGRLSCVPRSYTGKIFSDFCSRWSVVPVPPRAYSFVPPTIWLFSALWW